MPAPPLRIFKPPPMPILSLLLLLLLLLSLFTFVPGAAAPIPQSPSLSQGLRRAKEWVGSLENSDPQQDLCIYRYNRYKTWRQLLYEAPTDVPVGQVVAQRMAHFFLDRLSSDLLADWDQNLLSQEELEELLYLGFADIALTVACAASGRQPNLSRLVAAAIVQGDTEFISNLIDRRQELPHLAQFIETPEFWLQLCDSRVSSLFDCFAECLSDSSETLLLLAAHLKLALSDPDTHQQNDLATCSQKIEAFLSRNNGKA